MVNIYSDRAEAGRKLADALSKYSSKDCIVFGIPRGGVVVAEQVSKLLQCQLDIVAPRKIGAPFQPEYAVGAVCSWNNQLIIDNEAVQKLNIADNFIETESKHQLEEARRRTLLYRGNIEPPDLSGKLAIVVDDGIATGLTAQAALLSLSLVRPKELIFAAPVGAIDSIRELSKYADKVICPLQPPSFYAVGAWYKSFGQTTDEEVISILERQM